MIVLGIDPGRTSGWAIATDPETVLEHGVAKSADHRAGAVHRAITVAMKRGADLRVCMEWVTAGGGGAKTAMGIGQARGRWLEAIELQVGYSERRVIRCTPYQWRKATHGLTKASGDTRADRESEFKRAAMAYTGIGGPDAAEAACVAMYGIGEVVS